MKKIAAQATIYVLWKERNSRIHNSTSLTTEFIFKVIDRSIRDTLLPRRFCNGGSGLLSQWFTFSELCTKFVALRSPCSSS